MKSLGWVLVAITLLYCSLRFSFRLGDDWSTDYGHYYVGASLLSDNYRLYQEHFDHKGPVLYGLLRAMGRVIGYGPKQAFLSLLALSFFLLASLVYFFRRQGASHGQALTYVLLFCSVLFQLDTNASISLPQFAFLFLAFTVIPGPHPVRRHFLATFFWSLSALTRIDTLPFGILLPLSLVWHLRDQRKKIVPALIGVAVVALAPLAVLSAWLDFSLPSFFAYNIGFNLNYRENAGVSYWYHPTQFTLIKRSLLPLFLLAIAIAKPSLPKQVFSFFRKNPLLVGFGGGAALLFIAAHSDKSNHILMLTPLLAVGLVACPPLERTQTTVVNLVLVVALVFAGANQVGVLARLKHLNTTLQLQSEQDRKAVELLQRDPNVALGLVRGWYILFAGSRPTLPLFPAVLFEEEYTHVVGPARTVMVSQWNKMKCQIGTKVLLPSLFPKEGLEITTDLSRRSRPLETIGELTLVQIDRPCGSTGLVSGN